MRTCLPHTFVWLAATLASVGGAAALASMDTVQTGWAPLVRLYGHGSSENTVKELRRLTAAYTTALHHTEIDESTQDFIDGVLEDLEDFDLDSFHERLPEERGKTRELWVRGDLSGKKYVVRRADQKEKFQVSLRGSRTELAAMSGIVRSTPGRGHGDRPTYLLSGRYGLGAGALTWNGATEAISEFVQVLSEGQIAGAEVAPPAADARSKASKLHGGLAEEDMAVLSLLFDAYPKLSETLSRMGRVDNVRTVFKGKNYRQISVKVRGLMDRFEEHYPALAKHMGRLDDLAKFDIRWLDREGRTLLNAKVDSDKLTVQVDCYVRDGKLIPSRGVQVFEDQPLEYLGSDYDQTRFVVDARFKMLGVVIKVKNLVLDNWYKPHDSYAEMGTALRSVPSGIHVEGAALGFVPTGLVDAFIPGNIESITRDFFTTAAKGNGGKGVAADLNLGTAAGGKSGVIDAGISVEALDNFLVKIGLGMVNDRLVPNERAIEQAKKFGADLHDGFVQDLSRYATKSGGG
jgi:hypothetical protein